MHGMACGMYVGCMACIRDVCDMHVVCMWDVCGMHGVIKKL